MFDLGGAELLVIGVVALIVVGPKDLPMLFRQVGRFVGKAKAMAREFSYAMNQAADEAGVKEAKDGFQKATSGLNTIANPLKAATDSVQDVVRDATRLDGSTEDKPSELDPKRAEAAKKIQEATALKEEQRRAAEAAAKAEEVKDAE